MSPRVVAEYLVPEVLVRPAAKEDVSDGLPSLPTLAFWAGDVWQTSAEEVVGSDFLCSQLHQQSALSLAGAFMELEHRLGRPRCVSVGSGIIDVTGLRAAGVLGR